MRVTPLHPHLGARADGIDLRSPLTAELRAAIEANDRRRMFNLGNRLWHSDSGFKRTPSKYLSAHIGRIDGFEVPEALALVRDLVEHATRREFVHPHRRQLGDLVVWDNRCTMHRGRAYDDTLYPRDMRRVTLEDSAPTLEQAL